VRVWYIEIIGESIELSSLSSMELLSSYFLLLILMLVWIEVGVKLQTLGHDIALGITQAFFGVMWFTVTIFLAFYIVKMFQLHKEQKIHIPLALKGWPNVVILTSISIIVFILIFRVLYDFASVFFELQIANGVTIDDLIIFLLFIIWEIIPASIILFLFWRINPIASKSAMPKYVNVPTAGESIDSFESKSLFGDNSRYDQPVNYERRRDYGQVTTVSTYQY